MDDRADEPSVAVLLEALPELRATYAALTEVDEDPSPQLVFNELADQAADLLRSGADEDRLEAIFAAVERVVTTPGVDAVESVAFGFLDALPMELQQRATAYVGPATEELWRRLDEGVLDSDDELRDLEGDDLLDDASWEDDEWDDDDVWEDESEIEGEPAGGAESGNAPNPGEPNPGTPNADDPSVGAPNNGARRGGTEGSGA